MDTRESLEEEVLGWLDEEGDTSTVRTNVRNALGTAHRQRLLETDWPFLLWPEPQTFALVSGQKNYALHSEYGRPLYFRNVTEDKDLVEVPFRNYEPSYTDEQFRFVLWNRSPVAAHPSSASPLSIVSSASGDTSASRAINVRGMTADGMASEAIAPNGTTPVASTNTYLPGGLIRVSKVGTWTGTMTMTSNAGAVTNLKLLAAEKARTYQQIRMLWTPSAVDEIEYQFFRNPTSLDDDDAVPDIPFPHSGILVWDALLLLAAYDGRIDSARKAIWSDNQQRMDLAMRQAFLDGQSLKAEPAQIHEIDD